METTDLERYAIHSSASFAETGRHVLKHDDTFAVLDLHGDITFSGNQEQGLYHRGTRFLSRFELVVSSRQPVLLNSNVRSDNSVLSVNLTNADLPADEDRTIAHGTVYLSRTKFLGDATCYEHLRIHNFARETVNLSLTFRIEADYADIFEVRGTVRSKRGVMLPVDTGEDFVVHGYRGLDGKTRRTRITFSPLPASCSATRVRYQFRLAPLEDVDIYISVLCAEDEAVPARLAYAEAESRVQQAIDGLEETSCHIETSNEQVNAWIRRSLADLNMLLTEVPDGYYPYAGIPWFNTFFGRDGLLTALMTLWINPAIARGVLSYLASTQACEVDASRDAQPGKILHERRYGEMANLGEIPFGQYYGTVDATPLFVMLAGAYYEHTGDRAFMEQLWVHIERALHWIDTYGDDDGDGFVEYRRQSEKGLQQQGWKDSNDSVFRADGQLAEGPIALCEVQGYVYAAKRQAADLASMLGRQEQAQRLRREARQLQARFDEMFWCDDLSMYALALDGEKRPCRVRSSNAGHALFAGIARRPRAARLAAALFDDDMFSGWGIRTLSSRERQYNPMSYHNGSVWPHDNAVIGAGLGHYGFKDRVRTLLEVFLAASAADPLQRLPELFCGFERRLGDGPTLYPVACTPQAWATAVVFQLLQACLGLTIRAPERRVVFEHPMLPPFLQHVTVRNLKVGGETMDFAFQRYAHSVGVEVLRRKGAFDVEVIV